MNSIHASRLLTEPRRPRMIRESPRALWYVVATVSLGAFMGQLDASIVTVALPHIGRDLHAGVGAVEWVALAYLLVLILTVAAVGSLADTFGRKLLYTYGFGVFTAGSALCALAPSLPLLITARAVQALGAAMLQANSIALITEALPPRLLGRGIGIQGSAQAIGLALGPAIGGVLLALSGWRLIFLINLPAGALGLLLGWLLLPRSRTKREARRGSGLEALRDNLRLLRRPALSIGLSSGLVSFMLLFGTLFTVPYFLAAHHVGSARTGLELATLPVALGATALLSGRATTRVDSRVFTAGGMLLMAAGLAVMALWPGTPTLLTGLALTGVGLGAFTPANNASIMAAAPSGYAGLVGGILNMTRASGTGLGVAFAAALYAAWGWGPVIGALGGIAALVGVTLMVLGRRAR